MNKPNKTPLKIHINISWMDVPIGCSKNFLFHTFGRWFILVFGPTICLGKEILKIQNLEIHLVSHFFLIILNLDCGYFQMKKNYFHLQLFLKTSKNIFKVWKSKYSFSHLKWGIWESISWKVYETLRFRHCTLKWIFYRINFYIHEIQMVKRKI